MAEKIKIGLMPCGIDGLALISRPLAKKIEPYFLLPQGKSEADWAAKFLPKKNFIFYHLKNNKLSMATLDLNGVAKNSDLASQLKAKNVNQLLVHHSVGKYLEGWARRYHFKLVVPDIRLARRLENKIWFDDFLKKSDLPKPASQIFRPRNNKVSLRGRLVLQEPVSEGGEGTYFINQPSDFKKLMTAKKIKPAGKYLLRQYVVGQPYGITVFLMPELIALSALRLQCYSAKSNFGQHIFSGIQWLSSKNFSARLKKNLNEVFYRLGRDLIKNNFFGYANIDFIVDRFDQIYILECNPRPAASTIQLIIFRQTISGLDTGKRYLDHFLFNQKQNKKAIKFLPFPASNFVGSVLYLQTPNQAKKFLIAKDYPGGIYHFKKNKIVFERSNIINIDQQPKKFIFTADAQAGDVLDANVVIASAISNWPLYDNRGKLNKYGRMITDYFHY